jgi:diaminohydroxyphosphoribosylaminopyrimidine deaminase/5-amino-6-(5-phosphoribosylamino)uracil reductase
MGEAVALGEGSRGRSAPNPNVGCVIVAADGRVVGRGATGPGGRPHAEAIALAEAGAAARGATVYVTLEPCAHESPRGPACIDLLVGAGPSRVVIALRDPDPRTDGRGAERLRRAGIIVELGLGAEAAARSMAGFLSRLRLGRPFVTLKLAMSIDGKIALPSGESRWITGEDARADVHRERARADMILVGRGTYLADAPRLDVRLPGLEDRSPRRALLTRGEAVEGWTRLGSPEEVHQLDDVNDLLVEGGSATATAFLAADLVDRMLIYRAPLLIGEGKSSVGSIGLEHIADAHGRWRLTESRPLGIDRLEVYERLR